MAVVATDTDTVIRFANRNACSLYGVAEEGLLGLTLDALVTLPEPQQLRSESIAEILAGNTWKSDLPARRLDGATFLAGITCGPIRDEDGGVVGMLIVSEDVTETRLIEAAAAATERRLQLAHQAAALGTWQWDIATGEIIWDEQLEAVFGLPLGGFDGTFETFAGLLHPDDRDQVLGTVQEAMEQRSTYIVQHRTVWPDGSVHWIEGVGRVTVDLNNEPTGTIGCSRDVTERALAQQALSEAVDRQRFATERAEQLGAEREELRRHATEIADHLQASLAPNVLPDVPGVELAAHYATGGHELEHIGGDWYDVVDFDDGRLFLTIGDVMGRGTEAATAMIWVRGGIHGLVTMMPTPDVLIGTADELLTRDAPDLFVTALAASIDVENRRLSICNAGHVPALLVPTEGPVTQIAGASGPPLGMLDDQKREVEVHDLAPGTTVLLVTDGVIESRAYDIDEGLARLAERASAMRQLPLTELVVDLAGLADPDLHDDVTVLAVRVP